MHILLFKDLSYLAPPVYVFCLSAASHVMANLDQVAQHQLWRAIAPPPWLGQAGRVAISLALHAEHRIRLPSLGTGNNGPRLSINGDVASSAL